jgi:hypothetical protein
MYPPSSIMTPEPEPDWVREDCRHLAQNSDNGQGFLRRRQEQKGSSLDVALHCSPGGAIGKRYRLKSTERGRCAGRWYKLRSILA